MGKWDERLWVHRAKLITRDEKCLQQTICPVTSVRLYTRYASHPRDASE